MCVSCDFSLFFIADSIFTVSVVWWIFNYSNKCYGDIHAFYCLETSDDEAFCLAEVSFFPKDTSTNYWQVLFKDISDRSYMISCFNIESRLIVLPGDENTKWLHCQFTNKSLQFELLLLCCTSKILIYSIILMNCSRCFMISSMWLQLWFQHVKKDILLLLLDIVDHEPSDLKDFSGLWLMNSKKIRFRRDENAWGKIDSSPFNFGHSWLDCK